MGRVLFALPAVGVMLLMVVVMLGMISAASPAQFAAGLRHPLFVPALYLSVQTTCISLFWVVVAGTPLAWWLATTQSRWKRGVELMIDLPVVIPPAVIGVALLQTFGRNGLLGPMLSALGLQIPFTPTAVVLAQVVVSLPFYVQSASSAFGRVNKDLLLVSRTLGQSSIGSFFRVAVPIALPGLLAGAALSWGRALGEFGATLLFAGNRTGHTQTMPLAIYTALESDVHAAIALSLCLGGVGVLLLGMLRLVPASFQKRGYE